jgi:uncharacterized membrane protein
MTQVAAWVFDDEQGARRIELLLGRLAANEALLLGDGRVLVWPPAAARPSVRRIYSVPLTDAVDDIVWGLLLGQVLYGSEPAVAEPLAALGVDGRLIKRLREELTPGRSGLVVLGQTDAIARLKEALATQLQ